MHLNLTPHCEPIGLNHALQERQQAPVYQLIHHFMCAKALSSRPPPEWRRIKKSRQKPFIFAFQHTGSNRVIVAYQNLLGENVFIDPVGF